MNEDVKLEENENSIDGLDKTEKKDFDIDLRLDSSLSEECSELSNTDDPSIDFKKLLNDLTYGCFVRVNELSDNSAVTADDEPIVNLVKLIKDLTYGCCVRIRRIKTGYDAAKNSLFLMRSGRKVRSVEIFQAGFS